MKKIFLTIFILLIGIFGVMYLTACDGDDQNNEPHQHEFVEGLCSCGEIDPNYKPSDDF